MMHVVYIPQSQGRWRVNTKSHNTFCRCRSDRSHSLDSLQWPQDLVGEWGCTLPARSRSIGWLCRLARATAWRGTAPGGAEQMSACFGDGESLHPQRLHCSILPAFFHMALGIITHSRVISNITDIALESYMQGTWTGSLRTWRTYLTYQHWSGHVFVLADISVSSSKFM